MADVAYTDNGQQRSGRSVELRVAATLENLAVLRTLVAAVGTFEDLDFDAVADLRLAVDEACTRLIRSAMPDSMLLLVIHPKADAVVIDVSTACKSPDILAPGSFSWHVLSSLTDEVHTFQDGQGPAEGRVFGISMMTSRASVLRCPDRRPRVRRHDRTLNTRTSPPCSANSNTCLIRRRSSSASVTASSSGACRSRTTSPAGSTGAANPATIWCRWLASVWSMR